MLDTHQQHLFSLSWYLQLSQLLLFFQTAHLQKQTEKKMISKQKGYEKVVLTYFK